MRTKELLGMTTISSFLFFILCFGFVSCSTTSALTEEERNPIQIPQEQLENLTDEQKEALKLEYMTDEQKKFYKLKKTTDYEVIGRDLDYKIMINDEKKEIIVQFEETDSDEDWTNNFLCFPYPLNLDGHTIWTTYGYARIYESAQNIPIDEFCKLLDEHPGYKSVIRGWSLGSAMAKILARHYIIRSPEGTKIDELTTYGDIKCWVNPFYSLKKYCNVIHEYCNPNDLVTWSMFFYGRDVTTKVGGKFSFRKAKETEFFHTHYENCDYSRWTDN